MERQVHEYLRELIGQIAPEPHHVVVNGWYFYSLNWLPVPGVALLRNFISIVPRLPRNWRSAAGMFPQTIRFAAGGFEEFWREQLLPEYRQLVSDAEHRMPELDAGQLVEMVDRLADAAGRYFGSIAVVSGAAYKFEAQLAQFWNKHLRDDLGVSHMVVLQGFEQAAVTSKTPRLETLDWSRPAMPPAAPSGHLDRLRSQRQDFELRALSHLEDSPRKLAKFRRLLADAQHQMPIREEQISQLGIAWPPMRLAIQRIGETLVAMNSIASVEDVYVLSKDEVLSLLDSPNDMSKAVNQRHLHLEEASRLVPPLTVGQVPLAVKFLFSMSERIQGAQHDPAALVHGTPASPGRATGKVRIIRNSSQFETFQEGEILVAPLTAPAWTDLFDRAAAVVTDVGSALAHASIIAREYGIPAVVGCGDATARLVDGQVITVDGSTGNVEPGAGGGHDQ
jgi:pyruvate,water dikinase